MAIIAQCITFVSSSIICHSLDWFYGMKEKITPSRANGWGIFFSAIPIQEITESQIDFEPASFQIPHLTVEMGYVKTDEEFKILMNELYTFAKGLSAFEVNTQKPFLKPVEKDYIFVGIAENEIIFEIKRKIKERLKKWIVPLEWDVSKGDPHITVGYIGNHYKEVEQMIEKYPVGPTWIANTIEISYTGPKGSCLGTIRSFEFGKLH